MTQAITSRRAGVHPIVVGGTIAGILDILAATVYTIVLGGSPIRMLKGIASGLLGPAALQGGGSVAVLGLLLHFVIAFGATTVYYAASRVLPFLVRRPIESGLAYGVIVYAVMQQVVLPLSRVTQRPSPWSAIAIMVAIHMLFVGLPIALAVRRGSGITGVSGWFTNP